MQASMPADLLQMFFHQPLISKLMAFAFRAFLASFIITSSPFAGKPTAALRGVVLWCGHSQTEYSLILS